MASPKQFALLAHSHRNREPDDFKLARRSAIFKGVAVLVLVSLSIAFTIMLWRGQAGGTRGHDIAGKSNLYSIEVLLIERLVAVLEWVIGFCFNGYLLTFVYDLRHARSRESIIECTNGQIPNV